jgi:hypothetical protein
MTHHLAPLAKINFDSTKNSNTNNVNVNVITRDLDTSPIDSDIKVIYGDDKATENEQTDINRIQALELIIDIMRDNPLRYNKLVLVDDLKLIKLVQLLTNADKVSIDAKDYDITCCGKSNTYRDVEHIYVIKNNNTYNLEVHFPDVCKYLSDLGICKKFVF